MNEKIKECNTKTKTKTKKKTKTKPHWKKEESLIVRAIGTMHILEAAAIASSRDIEEERVKLSTGNGWKKILAGNLQGVVERHGYRGIAQHWVKFWKACRDGKPGLFLSDEVMSQIVKNQSIRK